MHVCVAKPVAVELRCHVTALIFFLGGGSGRGGGGGLSPVGGSGWM